MSRAPKITTYEEWVDYERSVLQGVSKEPLPDVVNHPPHYTTGAVECIDALEAALGPDGFRAYCRGAAIKYLWRGPHKGAEVQDYQKAEFYLRRLIQRTEGP